MGFYGNIADTSKIQFQFDKIFNSRLDMDTAALQGTDGIFSGRFVLVKYDPDGKFFEGDIIGGYLSEDVFYADITCEKPYIYTTFTRVVTPNIEDWKTYYRFDGNNYFALSTRDQFVSTEENYYTADAEGDNLVYLNQILRLRDEFGGITNIYYKCTGDTVGENAVFEIVVPDVNLTPYLVNYNKDQEAYGNQFDPRGYDATVWEKVYSEGNGKFINIAYLNAMAPGMELFPDAPSLFPTAPYIDGKSSDSFYRIHVPSHWGFRIKEAEKEIDENENVTYINSDQTISQPYLYDEEGVELDLPEVREIHADIYFNKKASDRLYKNRDTTTVDKIVIEPTGESGKVYYDEDGNETKLDTYELSVHLPMIGNLVSDGYDLIYGENEEGPMRPTDIQWYSGDSSSELKENGNSSLGGKTYDLNTIAGSLNTIHNILGQIIVPLNSMPTESEIRTLSSDYIYNIENRYYRRGIVTEVNMIEDDDPDFYYDQQTYVSEEDFVGNKYYQRNGNTYIPVTGNWDSNLASGGYYLKNINRTRYEPVELTQYESGQFYIKEGENYICDNAVNFPSYEERTYYTNIDFEQQSNFRAEYASDGTFYTFTESNSGDLVKDANGIVTSLQNGSFTKSFSETPSVNETYFTLVESEQNSGRLVRYYRPNVYYYREVEDLGNGQERIRFRPATEPTMEHSAYWLLVFDEDNPEYGMDENGNIIQYYKIIQDQSEEVTVINPPAEPQHIYMKDNNGNYICYNDIANLPLQDGKNPYTVPRVYYRLALNEQVSAYPTGVLYLPDVYHYKNSNNDYIKSKGSWDRNQTYYLVFGADEVEHDFYIADRYYYEVSVNYYEVSHTIRMTIDPDTNDYIQYYIKSAVYVDNDSTGQCPHGYEWSDYAAYIPPSVSLYTKEIKAGLILLPDLGKDTNSLFGLLLKLNKLYAVNDDDTRDADSIRGMYNTLSDMMYQIKPWHPGQLLFVNDFGQIESISITKLKQLLAD